MQLAKSSMQFTVVVLQLARRQGAMGFREADARGPDTSSPDPISECPRHKAPLWNTGKRCRDPFSFVYDCGPVRKLGIR